MDDSKSGQVERQTPLLDDLPGDLHREAVGVVQLEGHRAREHRAALVLGPGDRLFHQHQSLVEGAVEALFLGPDGAQDGLPPLHQFRVGPPHEVDGPLGEALQERRLHAGRAAEAGGAADDAAQHVAPALVAGQDAVGDEERHGPGMVGQHPQGDVDLPVVAEPSCRRSPPPVRPGA